MSLARLALLHERFIGAVVFDGLWLRLRLGGSMFALGLSLEFAQTREHVLHGVAAAARMTQLLHGGGHEGMLDVKRRKRGDFEQLLRRGTLVGVLRETLRHEVHELRGPLGLVR